MILKFRKRAANDVAKAPSASAAERAPSIQGRPTPVTSSGGAWYHDAAIADAERGSPTPR